MHARGRAAVNGGAAVAVITDNAEGKLVLGRAVSVDVRVLSCHLALGDHGRAAVFGDDMLRIAGQNRFACVIIHNERGRVVGIVKAGLQIDLYRVAFPQGIVAESQLRRVFYLAAVVVSAVGGLVGIGIYAVGVSGDGEGTALFTRNGECVGNDLCTIGVKRPEGVRFVMVPVSYSKLAFNAAGPFPIAVAVVYLFDADACSCTHFIGNVITASDLNLNGALLGTHLHREFFGDYIATLQALHRRAVVVEGIGVGSVRQQGDGAVLGND